MLTRRLKHPVKELFRSYGKDADVVVIGGGHAGCESAAASSRCGAKTILITHDRKKIGEMSCNPSFGGIGKGHLIREVDALDGLCAKVCDKSAITYQALNRAHGPAVIGLRAQIDRDLYKKHMINEIENLKNFEIIEGEVTEIIVKEVNALPTIVGVRLDNNKTIISKNVVITTGTFLRGEIYQGMRTWPAGRIGEKSSNELSRSFMKLGLKLGRLRTGTPPRLLANTIDFSKFEIMAPDRYPIPFSFLTKEVWISPEKQLPTYLGYTNEKVNEIAKNNFANNLQVTSEIVSPRYCPSLESKLIRFPDLKHRLFLEHEGLDSQYIYPQGMSMTFTPDVQEQILRAIPGLEKVELFQPGYGVQYDFVDPKQLKMSLETKSIRGLFLAGQINGTTGYEEAAAQGIIAGINAANEGEPLLLSRTNSYIGVLIDDLTSTGTNEPYRMLTSRAECRLHLRPDNADIRLTGIGRQFGVISDERWNTFIKIRERLELMEKMSQEISMSISKWKRVFPKITSKSEARVLPAFELIHRFNLTIDDLNKVTGNTFTKEIDNEVFERLKIDGMYRKENEKMQLKRQEIEKEALTQIPENIDYSLMNGLSMECIEKLERARPKNLAAATRISGITPEAIVVLLRHLKAPFKSNVIC